VWQEAASLSGKQREQFLHDVARPRMKQITELCAELARPWGKIYTPVLADAAWYKAY
jgi:hypothetical protein